MEKVRALQARALGRADPLAANLGVIAGDLAQLVHLHADRIQARAAAGGGPGPAADLETFLKVVRGFDRLVQLEQRTAEAAGGE
jgi:hypothetical protein